MSEKNVTEEAYKKIKEIFEKDDNKPKKVVSVAMTLEEKQAVYFHVLDKLRASERPETVANDVVAFLNDFLDEKAEKQKGDDGVKGPVFRRVE